MAGLLRGVQAFGGHQGACVLIREGLTLTVGALRAHVCAVCHLVGLGERAKSQSRGPGKDPVERELARGRCPSCTSKQKQ